MSNCYKYRHSYTVWGLVLVKLRSTSQKRGEVMSRIYQKVPPPTFLRADQSNVGEKPRKLIAIGPGALGRNWKWATSKATSDSGKMRLVRIAEQTLHRFEAYKRACSV